MCRLAASKTHFCSTLAVSNSQSPAKQGTTAGDARFQLTCSAYLVLEVSLVNQQVHGIQEDLDRCDLVGHVRRGLVVALHSSRLELMGNEQPLAIAGGHKPLITQQRLRLHWTEAFLLGPTQQVTF